MCGEKGAKTDSNRLTECNENSEISCLSKQEMWVQSLDQEDPLEKEMAPHSRIHVWNIL